MLTFDVKAKSDSLELIENDFGETIVKSIGS